MKKFGGSGPLRAPRPSVPTSPKCQSKVSSRLASPRAPVKIEEKKSTLRADARKVGKVKPAGESKKTNAYTEALTASVSTNCKSVPAGILLSALSKHFIFSSLPPEHQTSVVSAMKHYRLPAQELVFEQGKPAVHFFVVAEGSLEVLVDGRRVNVVREGDGFGELALLHDTPRSATVRSLEACSLWAVDGATFRRFLTEINQQAHAETKAFVSSIPLFAPLTSAQKDSIVSVFTPQQFAPGQRIVNEGDPGDLCYIVKEGTVSCTKGGIEIRRLGRGEMFGEQALLLSGIRTATVTAVDGPVKCVAAGRKDLVAVLGNQLQKVIYRNTLRMAIEKNEVLRTLTREQRERVVDSVRVCTFSNGQTVVPKGLPKGEKLWIVLKGAVGNSPSRITADTLSCIGESDFIVPSRATYTEPLIAVGETVHVAEIAKTRFEECLGGELRTTVDSNEAEEGLKKVPLLRGLGRDRLLAFVSVMQIAEFRDGETIVRQGDAGDSLFIVKSGKVNVLKDGITIRTITKHDYFGERALLTNEIRTATVIARGDVTCWTLHKAEFLRFVDESMQKSLRNRILLQDDSINLQNLTIIKVIGKGMFGNVFLASNIEKGNLYALKTVNRSKVNYYEIEENLIQERRILLQVDHDMIVRLYKTFKDAQRVYFLMEFVCGQDLFDVLRVLGLLSATDARFYIAGILLVLEHLHEREIIYRDMKPENIMIDDDGYPKLIDFGTSKLIQSRTYTIVGTPHYMAPEVIMGKGYSFPADIYSVGIMLYEFLCGVVPFGEEETDAYAIYQSVLEHKVAFPLFLEERSMCRPVIEQLISENPAVRLGGGFDALKGHKWFSNFDWVKDK